ncbi:MAG TPA: SDR family oxidoreductase [Anaerolineales bacterium]|nr:SDR family oxidoreductase [Anaerolineales bacterium]
MELKAKVAIVTGAGRGIGKAVALALAEKGCRLLITARNEAELEAAEAQIRSRGGEARRIAVDLAGPGGPGRVTEAALSAFGTIDILINNAAILYDTRFLEVSEEEWDRVMSVNLKAPFLLSQASLRVMREKRSGYIINISSTAALQVPVTLTTYGTSKKALIGLSEALYETAKEFGVKVSVIYPGMTDTEMLRGFNPPVPPDRWMKTDDIVGCILFLLEQSERVVLRDLVPWAVRHDKI